MQAIKNAPEMLEHQQGAYETNHLQLIVNREKNQVVFTEGQLCPQCKRGHLKSKKVLKTTGYERKSKICDRCIHETEIIYIKRKIPAPVQVKDFIINRKDRIEIYHKWKKVIDDLSETKEAIMIKTGVNSWNIQHYFNGKGYPRGDILKQLCEPYGVEVAEACQRKLRK